MNLSVNRRDFLRTARNVGAGVALSGLASTCLTSTGLAADKKQLDWKICCAAYSFNALTFVEMLAKVKQLGLEHVEGFNWQQLCKDKPKVKTDASMSAADRREMRKRVADAGLKMELCYISRLQDKNDAQKTFEWAKDLGIKTFVAEPPFEAYDMVEKLCNEYAINLAVHNHPSPSKYFNPDTTVKVCKGRGKRIGACCDTGHWVRSGFDPVAALKKLEGRIISLHLKDVERFGDKKAECVPWGTGKGSIAGIMKELHRQGFEGTFSIEYEPYRPENFDKIAQCIAFFKKEQAKLEA